MHITVKVDLSKLRKLFQSISDDRANPEIIKAWTLIYNAFTRDRYDKLSKHGTVDGYKWKELAQSTIDARPVGKAGKELKKGKVPILRNFGLLFAAIRPGINGGILQQSSDLHNLTVTIYLDGGQKYDGGATLSEIAKFHQVGDWRDPPRPPQRIILADPPDRIKRMMAGTAKKILVIFINKR